jgi:hypothetical protein
MRVSNFIKENRMRNISCIFLIVDAAEIGEWYQEKVEPFRAFSIKSHLAEEEEKLVPVRQTLRSRVQFPFPSILSRAHTTAEIRFRLDCE